VIVAWTGGRPAASLAFERGAAAVALDVHLEDGGVMNHAVDDRGSTWRRRPSALLSCRCPRHYVREMARKVIGRPFPSDKPIR
jgi:hypothetical protein